MKRYLLGCALIAIAVGALRSQTFREQAVSLSGGAIKEPWVNVFDYDGSNNTIYVGSANADQARWSPSINNLALTSIVDATNTSTVTTAAAHGLAVKQKICVEGASDTDLNACYAIATVPTTTTFTITTANVTDATYNAAGLSFYTNAPRTTQPIWSIVYFPYSGSNVTRKMVSDPGQIWDNRTTISYR